MSEYFVTLKEWYSNQVYHDLKNFGVEVIWVSQALPYLIAIKTYRTEEELEKLCFVEEVGKVTHGTLLK
jgi:hypothetical protein